MDKKFTHILLYIYKHPYITYSCLQTKFNKTYDLENMIEQLSFDNMISFRIAESPKSDEGYEDLHVKQSTHLLCTSTGNEYIENKLENTTKWNITTAIALFAAIGAYRQELVYILQAQSLFFNFSFFMLFHLTSYSLANVPGLAGSY